MFKAILKAFRNILQALKKINWEVWTPIIILVPTIIYGISGIMFKNDRPYRTWEVAAVCSTIAYTLMILITGLSGDKFKGVNYKQGIIIGLLLVFIIYFALSTLAEELEIVDIPLQRVGIMMLYLCISICYVVIDFILIRAHIREEDEIKKSIFYCDGPSCVIFSVLLIFAYISEFQKINELNDTFFSGTIAFQMILASIVWGVIDNNESIGNWKLIKKLTGG